jgi:tripartite ATP-independent transporter DctP family solute receptor
MSKSEIKGLSRRQFLTIGAVAPFAFPAVTHAANTKFTYKFATGQDPTHPVNIRLKEAFQRIEKRTGGDLKFRLFPANVLGSDTDLISQVRNGSIQFLNISTSILATVVPVCGIVNAGYAFIDYKSVWKAMDGALGKYIQYEITKHGMVSQVKIWDNGFRQVTSSTREIHVPDDLKGFKIRTPQAPMLTSLFSALGASPTPLNFNEVYSSLQTKVIDGQENALSLIFTTRLYEVQKYCAMTGHSWDGYWQIANEKAWARLPADMREVAVSELNRSAVDERADVARLDDSLRTKLTGKGMKINDVDKTQFRDTLMKTDYYKTWKGKYGNDAWGQLEAASGRLA